MVEVRDQRCTHPCCDKPVTSCQVDHVVPFDAGGLTTQENAWLLCGPHNREAYRRWQALDETAKKRLIEAKRRAAEELGDDPGPPSRDGGAAPDRAPPGEDSP